MAKSSIPTEKLEPFIRKYWVDKIDQKLRAEIEDLCDQYNQGKFDGLQDPAAPGRDLGAVAAFHAWIVRHTGLSISREVFSKWVRERGQTRPGNKTR